MPLCAPIRLILGIIMRMVLEAMALLPEAWQGSLVPSFTKAIWCGMSSSGLHRMVRIRSANRPRVLHKLVHMR